MSFQLLRGAIFVEGDGEDTAAPRLLNRLWAHLKLQPVVRWERPIYRNNNLKCPKHLAEVVSGRWPELRQFAALMVIYDADFEVDGRKACPRTDGPAAAKILRDAKLPLPAAVVLPWLEFEHWIAACLPQLAGRDLLDPATGKRIAGIVSNCNGAMGRLPQRDGKGILRDHLDPPIYRERIHQDALTELLDFTHLEQHQDGAVPSFGTLCRACRHLHSNLGKQSVVYP